MKRMYFLGAILSGFILVTFILFFTTSCYAQFFPFFNPYISAFPPGFSPFYPSFSPSLPFFSPLPVIGAQTLNPVMSPLIARPPTLTRSAATTIIILPQATTPVTAYAPLGTLTLTPSTLVFLILLFTLHE